MNSLRWVLFFPVFFILALTAIFLLHLYADWMLHFKLPKWVHIFLLSPVHLIVFVFLVSLPVLIAAAVSPHVIVAGKIIMGFTIMSIIVSVTINLSNSTWRDSDYILNLIYSIGTIFICRNKVLYDFMYEREKAKNI